MSAVVADAPPPTAERAARGRTARRDRPRAALGQWEPKADREDPVAILERQAQARVPELVPIRYGRMLASPFAFYRGAAAIMAADLAAGPTTGLRVQLCGDAHLGNFGTFAAADRRLVFDINDFDETLPGPFEWDVQRLVASFEVAGRHLGFDRATTRAGVQAVGQTYRTEMRRYAEMPTLDIWYSRLDVDDLLGGALVPVSSKERRRLEKRIEKTRQKNNLRALGRLTEQSNGIPRFRSDPPLLVPASEMLQGDEAVSALDLVRTRLRDYRNTLSPAHRMLFDRYTFVDLAHKVVGVGSVGSRAWVALMLGRDGSDPLVLQVKEAQASVLEPYAGRSRWKQHGQRVVEGQRHIHAATDIFLGWVSGPGLEGIDRHFYVRQLWDAKGSVDLENLPAERFEPYAELCGAALARAHARSGDPVAIAAYLGAGESFERALASFAAAYAEINGRDHAALQEAVDSGRVHAELGV